MKKLYKRIGIIVFFVLVLAVIGRIEVRNFNNRGIDSPLIAELNEIDYENPQSLVRINPDIIKNNYSISNFYLMTYESEMQIRFRIAYPVPFMHGDIFGDTAFYLQDSEGNDLTYCIHTYSETFAGLNGINVTMIFDKDTYMSLLGEPLNLTIASSEEMNDIDAEKSYSYGQIEFIIRSMYT